MLMMPNPFCFTSTLVFRSPALPFINEIPANIIQHLLHDDRFLEAIYIATPVLYKQCIKLRDGKITDTKAIHNLNISLIKYYQRMYSRCTPFGMFAGCGIATWAYNETKVSQKESMRTRQTRLDMYYLCKLSSHLSEIEAIRQKISWYPNTSLYQITGCYRYIEYEHIKDKRPYKISEAEHSKALETVINASANGILLPALIALLQKTGYALTESVTFVEQLIRSQILVSDLEPAVTGEEPLEYIIGLLVKVAADDLQIHEIITVLQKIAALLLQIDNCTGVCMELYGLIMAQLNFLGLPYDETKLFQVDLYHSQSNDLPDVKWQVEIMDVFSFLNGINTSPTNKNLKDFKAKFTERYEEQWVPLNEVLDADMGVGYSNEIAHGYSQMIEGLVLPSTKPENTLLPWNNKEAWLLQKLIAAITNNDYEVAITEDDVKQFPANWENLPPSMSVMFSHIEKGKVVLDGISGISAVNLLGRFANGLPAIHKLVTEITSREQQNNPDFIFAEILHLPENRTGNILLRPQLRGFEIPFLARCASKRKTNAEKSIPIQLDDLLCTVKQGEIVLYSKTCNKQVLPRLSTAHNFSLSTLPVYRFLCDLQGQHLRTSFRFNWGLLKSQFTFLPRVVMGNIILSEATWQFKRKEFEALADSEAVHNFFNKWKMPHLIVLSDGDNELLVDSNNTYSVDALLKMIKERQHITIKEYLKPACNSISNEGFACQYIAPIINCSVLSKRNNTLNLSSTNDLLKLQRSFIPGSEWLYVKIYCGIGAAEKILVSSILPLTNELFNSGYIEKWFFIRYNDPCHHIRLRFKIAVKEHENQVASICNGYFGAMYKNGLVYNIVYATYHREIERYGEATMHVSESLFCHNSRSIATLLAAEPTDERRLVWGLEYADRMLTAFGFSLSKKCALLRYLSDSFSKEFKADKLLFMEMSKKFRHIRPLIFRALDAKIGNLDWVSYNTNHYLVADYKTLQLIANEYNTLHANGNKMIAVETLVSSYLHMHFNRLFTSHQRVHEMLVYDYLHQYYEALIVIEKNKNKMDATMDR